MIKTKSITIITPLYDIKVQTYPVDGGETEDKVFNAAMDELGGVLSGSVNWFKIPTQNNELFILGKEVLVNSIVKVEMEECQEKQVLL